MDELGRADWQAPNRDHRESETACRRPGPYAFIERSQERDQLRHDYTTYDGRVRNAISDRMYAEILDEIARDFPWLAEQCAKDKADHPNRVPLWVQSRRAARQTAVVRQRAARDAIKSLSVGSKVLVNWRGQREATITEVRRTRVKAEFQLGHGAMYVIDRPADQVKLIET